MFKRSVVINAKRIKPIKLDYPTVILFSVLICGIIIGVSISKKIIYSQNDFLTVLINNYISMIKDCTFFECFVSIFLVIFSVAFIVFLIGFCAVGTPLAWLIPALYGCFCSSVITCLLIKYGIQGIGYCLLINIPCYAITAATIIKCCCESSRLSIELLSVLTGAASREKGKYKLLQEYIINYMILCIPLICAALLKTVSFKLFSGFFSFI